jgi:hypothetical protein
MTCTERPAVLQTNKNDVFLCVSHFYKQPFSYLHLCGGGGVPPPCSPARVLKPCFLLQTLSHRKSGIPASGTARDVTGIAACCSSLCGCPVTGAQTAELQLLHSTEGTLELTLKRIKRYLTSPSATERSTWPRTLRHFKIGIKSCE